MNLIENWREWYRMYSSQALMAIAAIQAALLALPQVWLQAHIPFTGVAYFDVLVALSLAGAALGQLGRLVKQPDLVREPPKLE